MKTENKIAKSFNVVAIIMGSFGFLAAIIYDDSEMISSIIGTSTAFFCLFLVGFGEIINLLQKSVNNQEEILKYHREKDDETEDDVKPKFEIKICNFDDEE